MNYFEFLLFAFERRLEANVLKEARFVPELQICLGTRAVRCASFRIAGFDVKVAVIKPIDWLIVRKHEKESDES